MSKNDNTRELEGVHLSPETTEEWCVWGLEKAGENRTWVGDGGTRRRDTWFRNALHPGDLDGPTIQNTSLEQIRPQVLKGK